MKVTPHQEVFLEHISNQGVMFSATHWALGNIPLKAKQIELFTEDSDQFAANIFGVSKKQLLAWGEFQSKWQCYGKTKSGARCKAQASNGFRVSEPRQYSSNNPNCYCPKHKDQA